MAKARQRSRTTGNSGALCGGLLILALAQALAGEDIEARTGHFRVIGPADAAPASAVALERLHHHLGALGFAGPDSRSEVVIFADAADMQPYAPPGRIAGFFQQGADASFLAVAWDPAGEPLRALAHELAHRVLQSRLVGRPEWLQEGLAELLSNLQPVPGGVLLGSPIPSHLEVLRAGRDTGAWFYAKSWAAAHRLVVGRSFGGTLAERIDALPHRLEWNPSVDVPVPVEVLPVPPFEKPDVRIRPLEPWERDHQRAELLRARSQFTQARAALTVLRARFPERPEPLESLGALEMDLFRYDEAQTLLARAIDLGAANPYTYYRHSLLLMRSEEAAGEAARHARRAVEIDPSQPMFWLARAHAEMQLLRWNAARESLAQVRARAGDPVLRDQVEVELAELERRREQALRPPPVSEPAARVSLAPMAAPPAPPPPALRASEPWRWPPVGTVLFIGHVRRVECTAEGKILTVANQRFAIRVRERRGQPAQVHYAPPHLRRIPCSMKNVSVNVVYRPLARFGPLNGDLVALLF
jgi:tetratricopeptide (TPR) repeat protein